jgi:hypothetical protein
MGQINGNNKQGERKVARRDERRTSQHISEMESKENMRIPWN